MSVASLDHATTLYRERLSHLVLLSKRHEIFRRALLANHLLYNLVHIANACSLVEPFRRQQVKRSAQQEFSRVHNTSSIKPLSQSRIALQSAREVLVTPPLIGPSRRGCEQDAVILHIDKTWNRRGLVHVLHCAYQSGHAATDARRVHLSGAWYTPPLSFGKRSRTRRSWSCGLFDPKPSSPSCAQLPRQPGIDETYHQVLGALFVLYCG